MEEQAKTAGMAKCPFAHGGSEHGSAFSVIDALPGFSRLGRRNETLNGSILARGTVCKPLLDGNQAGLYFWFAEGVMLSRDPESPVLRMTDELFGIVHTGYEERLGELIAKGLLVEGGYWHQRLTAGPVVRDGETVSIWTGLLVEPAQGLWLLATGSYNRRSEVNVREVTIASDDGYTPLMLELDLKSMPKDTMWLEAEMACLIPLQPGVTFTRSNIRDRPEVGRTHNEFYTEQYMDARAAGKRVGHYRKLFAESAGVAAADLATCDLIDIAGPDVNTIETFQNVVGTNGPMPEAAARLQFAVLRNLMTLEFDFDGIQTHLNSEGADQYGDELIQVWTELYGEENLRPVDWWTGYLMPSVPELLGEPQMLIATYVFAVTPPGWSALADGAHYAGLDGLRGVIATDIFHHAGPVFQYRRTGDFRIGYGEPLMRILPVPRHLLEARYEMVAWEDVS